MKADVHMHNSFSYDCKTKIEDMIGSAIEKGLDMICFTDHYDKDFFYEGRECIFDVEEYFRVLGRLKKQYQDIIEIRTGVELGLQPHLGPCFEKFAGNYPFDFIIGSVHVIKGMDPVTAGIFKEYSAYEVYRMTFEETLLNIRNIKDFDVLGHLDYVVRYGPDAKRGYSYETYSDIIDVILKELADNGKGLELNMAGLRFGLPFAHPRIEVLKRYRELGGEIVTVGADSHKPEQIAYAFDQADSILKECGFKYYTEYKGRRPYFKQLP